MNSVDFKVLMSLGECNGFMTSRWFVNGDYIFEKSHLSAVDQIEFQIKLPCTITIELLGKNSSTDTIINNGQIVQDKYIKIDSMWLARHPIPEHIYMKMCELDTGVDKFTTSYFGFTGKVNIHFDESDAIVWHFKHNHYKIS